MNDLRTRDLFARQFTEWRTQVNTFKFIKEVHNCLAVRDLSSIAYKDTKNKQKKIQEVADKLGQDLSISPPVSVSCLLFCCFTVLRECHCTKEVGRIGNYRVSWFDTSLTCEGVCQLFDVFQHEFSNLSLSCGGLFRLGLTSISCLLFNIANAGNFSTKIILPL